MLLDVSQRVNEQTRNSYGRDELIAQFKSHPEYKDIQLEDDDF